MNKGSQRQVKAECSAFQCWL